MISLSLIYGLRYGFQTDNQFLEMIAQIVHILDHVVDQSTENFHDNWRAAQYASPFMTQLPKHRAMQRDRSRNAGESGMVIMT